MKKTTKRALFMSVLSLLLCCSMLVGTTFAWFTDSVTSGKNKIIAGNLDVELYYQVEGQTTWSKVTETSNVFMEDALWEPGHTEVVKLKVVNEGTLALKYDLGVNVASEIGSVDKDGKAFLLSDYIKYGIVAGDQDYTREEAVDAVKDDATALNAAYASGTQELLAGNEAVVTMVVYMPTTVGNEANHATDAAQPTILLGIELFATQMQHEEDSFGKDYDKDAPAIEVTPATAQDVLDSLEGPATIKLAAGNYGTLVLDEGTVNVKTTTSNNMVGGDTLDMYTRTIPSLTIIGEDGAVVEGFRVVSQRVWDSSATSETSPAHYVRLFIDDLTVENVDFVGGGVLFSLYEGSSTCEESDLGNIKNVTFKDCSFTGNYGIRVINNSTVDAVATYCKPVNLSVLNSTFEKIGLDVADPANQGATALYIQYPGDLTVKGCTFSEIQYDSIQIAHRSSGITTITGNTFANTDGYKGYIARAMNLNGVGENAAVIEGNEFYKSNSTKSQKYIKAGKPITVGVNTWHELPAEADFTKVTIDLNAQIVNP